jgi:UPF0271 protein
MRVDLTCDVGEGAGNEAELFAIVTSANIACGVHAGDERTMRLAVALAHSRGVAIGAHPGLADREGLGRREERVTIGELFEQTAAQIAALQRIAREQSAAVSHVKPHGALYTLAARDEGIGTTVVRAVLSTGCPALFALAGSQLVSIARKAGLVVVEEAFADRGYRIDGSLVPRGSPGSLLTDAAESARRALAIVRDGLVPAEGGGTVRLRPGAVCVHGDTPHAVEIATAVAAAFREAGIELRRFDAP